MDFDNEFQAYFLEDGYGSLIKSVVFRSSSLNQLANGEVLAACILGYYSLLHFSLALVMLHPEKAENHRKLLLKLRDTRKEGIDPLDRISHNKLIEILRDMKLDNLYKMVKRGKRIREFYNYGPRTTWDADGYLYFGNPISENDEEKICPNDAIEFCRKIDRTILTEFASCLSSMYRVILYGLSGQFCANDHYLKDKSLHLAELFSANTIESAEKFLFQLKDAVDSRISLVNGES